MRSDASYGQLSIKLDKTKYNPGEQVNGEINLNLVKPFPSNTFNLVLKGEEFILFHVIDPTFVGRLKNKENIIFYENAFVLERQDSINFRPGQYCFAFSLKLREDLPGSFKYK